MKVYQFYSNTDEEINQLLFFKINSNLAKYKIILTLYKKITSYHWSEQFSVKKTTLKTYPPNLRILKSYTLGVPKISLDFEILTLLVISRKYLLYVILDVEAHLILNIFH